MNTMLALPRTVTWRDLAAVASLIGSLVFIGRWVGTIEAKVDTANWQLTQASDRLAANERKLGPVAGLGPTTARQGKQLNRIEAAVDNLHYRVSRIETAIEKHH